MLMPAANAKAAAPARRSRRRADSPSTNAPRAPSIQRAHTDPREPREPPPTARLPATSPAPPPRRRQDLTQLTFLHEPGVLSSLQARYGRGDIYTYTGSILIAVNPFCPAPGLYGPESLRAYASATGGLSDLPPHVYAVASSAWRAMRESGRGQAVLVTGESGAGKTETSKHVMRCLARMGAVSSSSAGSDAGPKAAGAGGGTAVERRVLESNPLLEAFGNAKTVRNDNSSRFGKVRRPHPLLHAARSGRCCALADSEALLVRAGSAASHRPSRRAGLRRPQNPPKSSPNLQTPPKTRSTWRSSLMRPARSRAPR